MITKNHLDSIQASTKIQAVVFRIEGHSYGIPITLLDEIIPMLEIKPIPQSPDFLEGVINLRGKVIPIIDLRKQLGYLRDVFTIESRIVVANFHSRKAGFIVDGVKNIKEMHVESIQPSVIKTKETKFIEGMAKLETGEMVQLIAINKVLDAESLKQLSKIPLDENNE